VDKRANLRNNRIELFYQLYFKVRLSYKHNWSLKFFAGIYTSFPNKTILFTNVSPAYPEPALQVERIAVEPKHPWLEAHTKGEQ